MANEFKIKNGLIVDQGGAQITGSIDVSGSIFINGGPLSFNTSSLINNANFSNPNLTFTRGDTTTFDVNISSLIPTSASYASTASFAPSYVLNSVTSSMLSPYVLTSVTSSMRVLSSSFALTASYALNGGAAGFPFSGSAIITGSLLVSGSGLTVLGILNATSSWATNTISSSYSTYSVTSSYASSIGPLTQNVTITGNLTVIGTASFTSVTGSSLTIGTSTIVLNTNNPAVRFGGISVIDSGSFGNSSTGSLFWDSQNNRWIYSNPSGSSYDGGMLISGPRNTTGLGNESGMDANFVAVGQGADHIRPGSIYNSGSITIVTGSLTVSGSDLTVIGNSNITGSILVNSPSITAGQFIGNQNGYVEFSLRNLSTGASASGDFAIYADNGTTTNNYIDMGINNSGLDRNYFYAGTDFGNANDAYLYNVGGDLRIGNATSTSPSQSLYLFANTSATPNITITGSRVGIQKSSALNATLDVLGNTIITGSLTATQGITGSLYGTASWSTYATNVVGIYAFNYTASYASSTSWTVNHNLGTKTVLVQAYDSTDNQIVPKSIVLNNANTATVTFNSAESGYAIASVGGALNFATASVANIALSANTASYVNTLSQNVIITGSATIGLTSTGTAENTLTLGPAPGGGVGEGGQLGLLSVNSGSYTSASFIDNFQNLFRILRGNNNTSNASILNADLQTGNITLPLGSIVMPARPAFRVTGSGGAIASTTVISGSAAVIDYNQGSYYNQSNGTFTAPIAGLYQVNLVVRTNSNSLGTISQALVRKTLSGSTTTSTQCMVEFAASTTMNHAGASTISSLAVGDTLQAIVTAGTISFDGNDNFSVAYIG